jgi:hypothetical protein
MLLVMLGSKWLFGAPTEEWSCYPMSYHITVWHENGGRFHQTNLGKELSKKIRSLYRNNCIEKWKHMSGEDNLFVQGFFDGDQIRKRLWRTRKGNKEHYPEYSESLPLLPRRSEQL